MTNSFSHLLTSLSGIIFATFKKTFKTTFLFLLMFCFYLKASAQVMKRNPVVVVGELIKVIPSLRDLKPEAEIETKASKNGTPAMDDRLEEAEEKRRTQDFNVIQKADPVVQRTKFVQGALNSNTPNTTNTPVASAPVLNFDGMGFTSVAPADPTMCAGPNHVVQMINGSAGALVKIWNRNGAQALAQVKMSVLAGNSYVGNGDPVALYDQFADRFMLTEFGTPAGGLSYVNTLIIAVSQTSDPLGGWFVYKFTDNSFFVDYPHWGIWPNVLYATSNDFNTAGSAYLGSSVYAINKVKMLAGDGTAELQKFRLNDADGRYGAIAPVSISGPTAPAPGSPGLFVYYSDDNFTPNIAGDVDSVSILSLQPDFAVPANTALSFVQGLAVAAFKSDVCNGSRNCIPSGGTGYDALSDRIMNRIYYRNFGTHECLVFNYTVDANYPAAPTKAGLRWYELRKSGGPWSIFQQSTYSPDADSRFMGTININSKGQIALGYNHSGAGKFASIYYAGRQSTDPVNTLTTNDAIIRSGTAYGTFSNRWGDYNDMATDVQNDSLFWMTAMYGNASAAWATRMTAFKLDGCLHPQVLTNPVDAGSCAVGNATYTATASGATSIQWELSTDNAVTFSTIPAGAPYSGETTTTLTITGATLGMNGYYYRCAFTNACGISYSTPGLLVVGGPTVTAPIVTQPACPAPANGTIVVNATGAGTLEYSLNGGAFQTSNTFSNLTPGSYNIFVRSQSFPACNAAYSGNPVVITKFITGPPTVTQPVCPTPATGTIVVNATGPGALEYSDNNGGSWQTSNTFSGLVPGSYIIQVRVQSTPSCLEVYSGGAIVILPPNTTLSTISYTGPAAAIPDNNSTGVNVPLTVSGIGTSIADINFQLDAASSGTCDATAANVNASVDHTWVGDLIFKLTSPSGTTVTLIDRIGAPPGTVGFGGNNFCSVTLDDDGGFAPIENTAVAPVAGNFSPNNPLSAFDGQDPNGIWTLNVSDNATADVGSVRRFSLVITASAPCAATPTITTTGTLAAFTACAGTASAEQTFTVAGANLTNNLTVTAPTGFEVSTTTGTGFGTSITPLVPASGTVSTTTIFVRMAATATGTPAGNIACASTGATTQNVAASGTVNNASTLTVTNNNNDGAGSLRQAVLDACPGSTITFDATVFAAPQTITLTTGEIVLNKNLTITGPVASPLSVSGNNSSRVFSITSNASVNINNLTITGGNAGGGAGGGIYNSGNGTTTLNNIVFLGNNAYGGGGMFNSGPATLTNVVFSNNTAIFSAGALQNNSYAGLIVTLNNVVFSGNSVTGTPGYGGAVVNVSTSSTYTNCTFYGNSASGNGGAMYNTNTNNTQLKNCIFRGNNAPLNADLGHQNIAVDITTITTSLFGVDPLFVNAADPDGADNSWITADDGLRLQSGSPAVNTGTAAGAPATDILGLARVGNTDMGAYEFAVVSTITTTGTLAAFTACAGTASAEQTFTVSGTGLTANLTVTAPAGFEVSTSSGTGFGTSITPLVPASGTVSTTTIFVRMAATATGTPSGNIACASTGATTQNVAASGTVNALPVITTPTVTQPTCATPTGTIVVNATGGGTLEYALNNGTYQSSATFSGLAPNSYNITVRLQANPTCIATYSGNPVVLLAATGCCVPPVITAPTVTQPSCATGVGSIVVNATGGGTLEYALNNGTYQSSNTFSGLTVGNYNITVRLQTSPSCLAAYTGNPVVINAPSCPGKTIPGRVEAEAWDAKNGPQYAVATGDPQGGVQHVVGIVNGSWMDYNVVVLQNGLYNVTFRVATTQNNPQFQIKLGNTVLGTVSIPNTGGWNTWQNVTVNNIALTAGVRTIRIQSVSNETCNFNWTDWVVAGANTAPTANAGPNQTVTNPPTTQVTLAGSGAANNGGTIISHVWTKFSGPAGGNITDPNNYGTTVTALQVGTYVFRLTVTDNASQVATSDVTIIVNPASGKFIPGRIEAEAWDTKAGPQYSVPTTDPEGGVRHVIGMSNGSWLDYNVNVTQAGAYTVTFRVATTQNSSQFQIKQGANVLATVNIPNSSGWDNWINVPVTGVQLTGTGTQTIRIQLSSNESCNFNWMDWQLTGAATAPSVTAGVDNPVITLPTNSVTLNGSGTANNGGSIINHQWTKFSGPAAGTITNPGNYGTTVTGLVAGSYVFRLTVTQNDNQAASADVAVTVNPVAGGNGKTIPGKIEAEAWDAKQGPQFATATTDAGGGQQVVGMTNGSWLDYNVNVLNTGSYSVNFRVATTQNNVQFQVRAMPGNTLLKTVNITNTGGWDSWQTIVVNDIALTAGLQTIRIQLSSNESCNFNFTEWFFAAPPIAPPLTVSATKQSAAGEEAKANKLQASVLPNPTSSYFNLRVQTKSMEQVRVRILDIAGRQVQQLKGNPEQAMRFGDNIVNGTYFVEVRQGAEKVVLKVMKQ